MGYFANRLKKRLEKMTDEQLEKKFLEMEESSNIGPTLDEYLKNTEVDSTETIKHKRKHESNYHLSRRGDR